MRFGTTSAFSSDGPFGLKQPVEYVHKASSHSSIWFLLDQLKNWILCACVRAAIDCS